MRVLLSVREGQGRIENDSENKILICANTMNAIVTSYKYEGSKL